MKKIFSLIAVVALTASIFSGCGGGSTPSTASPASNAPATSSAASTPAPATATKTVKMGLAMNQMDAMAFHAYADYLEKNAIDQGAARGYTVEWTMTNANGDPTKQANDIKDLLAKGCEVIFCPALDSKAILPSISEVHKAGKKFVMYFREADASATGDQIPDATINMDSQTQAYVSTKAVLEIMKADGIEPNQIIDVHGDITDENAKNREIGFKLALEEAGYLDRVAQVVDCGRWEPEVALANTAAALQANPDCNMLYTSSDYLMIGIQTAIENAGKWKPRGEEGHVYISASDLFPIGIDLITKKYIDGSVDQDCWGLAELAAKNAFDLLDGKEVTKENQLTQGVLMTSDNFEDIMATSNLWGVDYKDK